MIKTKPNGDPRSEQLNKMIRDACRMLQEEIENYSPKKDEIIDFIMENPDLPLTFNQIGFLLRNSYPAVSPTRGLVIPATATTLQPIQRRRFPLSL